MTKHKSEMLLAVVLLTLLSMNAPAQAPLGKQVPSISVTGDATVTVKPDQALIDIGVITQAQTAQVAAAQNSKKLDAVITELRKLLGQNANIKTTSYSLSRIYRYPREEGEPKDRGYRAANIVQVTLDDLTVVGKVIDAATQSGANQIQRLQFTLKDEQTVQLRALRMATAEAQAKAEAITQSLRIKILRVLSAGESGSGVQPLRNFALAGLDEPTQAPTPIEPGTIEVRATVRLTVEVGPR